MTAQNITRDRAWDFQEKLSIASKEIHRTLYLNRVGPHELASDINETLAELARAAGFDVEVTKSGMILTNQP